LQPHLALFILTETPHNHNTMTGPNIRKKVDSRIKTLIENGVRLGHRTMLVIVGDKGREQIANLHCKTCSTWTAPLTFEIFV